VGRKVFEEDTRRACPIEQNLDKIPDKPEREGIFYIMVDGAAINTRLKDAQGSSRRENKRALVFSSTDVRTRKDGVTHDILKKEYMPWDSRGEEALRRLEAYKGKKLPAGVVNPYTYIEHHKEKIDYGEYKRRGYYRGSGPIESGNKTVVQKRCKQAGMRWNEGNAQEMVTLKAKEESGSWGASVRDFIMAA
jgi:hypothetical protein